MKMVYRTQHSYGGNRWAANQGTAHIIRRNQGWMSWKVRAVPLVQSLNLSQFLDPRPIS